MRGNLALSEQYPFLRSRIPVLSPNPARGEARPGGDDTAVWDTYASAYHQPGDNSDLPLRGDVAERWVDYIEAFTAAVASSSDAPRSYVDSLLATIFCSHCPGRGEAW